MQHLGIAFCYLQVDVWDFVFLAWTSCADNFLHSAFNRLDILVFFAFAGLLIYALSPIIFPNCIYFGLVLGTILYSVSCGLGEVLLSPIIAAIPSENPDREMSKLHSVYAWGVAAAVVFSALFLHIFKTENWQWLVIIFTIVPLIDAIVYWGAEFPDVKKSSRHYGVFEKGRSMADVFCHILWRCRRSNDVAMVLKLS